MTAYKLTYTGMTKHVSFWVAWVTLLVLTFIATAVVLDGFPASEAKFAGLVVLTASAGCIFRGLLKLKDASVSPDQNYAPALRDIVFSAAVLAAVALSTMAVEGGCSTISKTGNVVTYDCGYGPIAVDTAGF